MLLAVIPNRKGRDQQVDQGYLLAQEARLQAHAGRVQTPPLGPSNNWRETSQLRARRGRPCCTVHFRFPFAIPAVYGVTAFVAHSSIRATLLTAETEAGCGGRRLPEFSPGVGAYGCNGRRQCTHPRGRGRHRDQRRVVARLSRLSLTANLRSATIWSRWPFTQPLPSASPCAPRCWHELLRDAHRSGRVAVSDSHAQHCPVAQGPSATPPSHGPQCRK